MITASPPTPLSRIEQHPHWASRAMLLWNHRRFLARVTAISLAVSLAIAFLIPKQYKSIASIMPPDEQGSRAMMLAALASHAGSLGALGGLAGSLVGDHSSTALFEDLLRSGTVSDHLITRFNLQHVYHKRYRVDAAKHLAHLTKITEDKKSGVITIAVEDTDRVRARDLTQAYLDELDKLVARTNTSAAHRERVFLEQRLNSVRAGLEKAELDLSRFSSTSSAVDIKEQTRALVDAGARLQAQLLIEQSGLESLRQIYGDGNVRVRQSEARIASLKKQLAGLAGSSVRPDDPADSPDIGRSSETRDSLYPPLRQIPRLAVPYADLYRRVRVEEAMFEFLNQQYEMARIEEAKDIPTVSVIDAPGIPEKKAFPPRLLLALLLTFLSFITASALILARNHWSAIHPDDPRKLLAAEVLPVLRRRSRSILRWKRAPLRHNRREEQL
ncbi:MAG: Wzz/FepE/Etk N-terminal domain-containing protein [Terracidiphilus sp.]